MIGKGRKDRKRQKRIGINKIGQEKTEKDRKKQDRIGKDRKRQEMTGQEIDRKG